jgi:hypothetical protein
VREIEKVKERERERSNTGRERDSRGRVREGESRLREGENGRIGPDRGEPERPKPDPPMVIAGDGPSSDFQRSSSEIRRLPREMSGEAPRCFSAKSEMISSRFLVLNEDPL